jgi:hypothetical protein
MRRIALLCSLAASSLGASFALAQTPVTPPGFQTPGGSGCAGEIARYRAVQENDYTSGNVAKSVYNQVKREIDAAERVCSAGNDAKATAMIRASEARHGYSTHL